MVTPETRTWVIAGLVFLAVTLGTIAVALLWEWTRELLARRAVRRQLERAVKGETGPTGTPEALFRAALADVQWVRLIAAHVPQLRDLERLLQQAGVQWSVQSFLLITAGATVGLGALALLATGSLPLAAACAAAGLLGPLVHVRSRRTRRLRAFEEQLPEAIDLLARAIRAGHPLAAGLKMVGEESPDPVGGEFRRVFEEQRFGLPPEDALLGLTERVGLMDVRILVTAILIQREVGGNLAEVLGKIAYTIRARFAIRRQLRVYTAQGRFSGYVLAVLPIAVGSMIFLLNPDYIATLFREPVGQVMLVTALILQLLGFLWIRRIVDIEI